MSGAPTVLKQRTVLLISPGILKWTDMDFGLPHMVSMGGYVKAHTGVPVQVLDLNYEGGDHHQLERSIQDLGPLLLIGLSCYSSFDYRRVMALAAFLKDRFPGVPLVTGGYHASAVPGDVDFPGSPFDSVVQGEGEEPLRQMVETLLGGGQLEPRYGPSVVADLDALPPTDWSLLDRYWPRATTLGRKFQVILARGCPYRCTFCMERAKSGYAWRPHSAARAVDELERLAAHTDLSQWVVNIADPLFGFRRDWRREVLQGIVDKGLKPRAFWTLTRSDDLDEPDFELLGAARFSIGIGLESGSPEMLRRMQKGNTPERYLGAVRRLADRSHAHGITWAVNVIVGHPGETAQSMEQTAEFVRELFAMHPTTRGWLSIDPFRLYPGSAVATERADWEARTGAVFHSPEWWKGWYDLGFHAQHIEPSSSLTYAERVRFMHETYRPIVADIGRRFEGQGREVDRVYQQSILGQTEALSEDRQRHALSMSQRAHDTGGGATLRVPLGLRMKDPWVRKREAAIRRLLDRGVLRGEHLIEALLQEGPEAWMPPEAAEAVLGGRVPSPEAEGLPPVALPIGTVAMALEALEPEAGMVVADLAAGSAWVSAVLARLVGPEGRVHVTHLPAVGLGFRALPSSVRAREVSLDRLLTLPEAVDRMFLGPALPRFPRFLADRLKGGGRAVASLGPRFRGQLLTRVVPAQGGVDRQALARVKVPVLAGPGGWISRPVAAEGPALPVFVRRAAPALAYHVLSHLDLGSDAANLFIAREPEPAWVAPLRAAWSAAPGRLVLHGQPLAYDDVDVWLDALEAAPPASLEDEAGLALRDAFVAAARAEAPAFLETWERQPAHLAKVSARLGPALHRLRERLHQAHGAPPPLVVLDCPALGGRGRATSLGGARMVATSLVEDEGHVLMQLLHEEVHPITDPIVRAEYADAPARDTKVGSPGWALHAALEQTVVSATDAFLRARAPELVHDFGRWRARVGA